MAARWRVRVDVPGGATAPLDDHGVLVGRVRTSDVIIAHPLVSAQHLLAWREAHAVWADDLSSRNGTFFADCAVVRPTRLRLGERVLAAGSVPLVFEADPGTDRFALTSASRVPAAVTVEVTPCRVLVRGEDAMLEVADPSGVALLTALANQPRSEPWIDEADLNSRATPPAVVVRAIRHQLREAGLAPSILDRRVGRLRLACAYVTGRSQARDSLGG